LIGVLVQRSASEKLDGIPHILGQESVMQEKQVGEGLSDGPAPRRTVDDSRVGMALPVESEKVIIMGYKYPVLFARKGQMFLVPRPN
jgi:hypothetical protein